MSNYNPVLRSQVSFCLPWDDSNWILRFSVFALPSNTSIANFSAIVEAKPNDDSCDFSVCAFLLVANGVSHVLPSTCFAYTDNFMVHISLISSVYEFAQDFIEQVSQAAPNCLSPAKYWREENMFRLDFPQFTVRYRLQDTTTTIFYQGQFSLGSPTNHIRMKFENKPVIVRAPDRLDFVPLSAHTPYGWCVIGFARNKDGQPELIIDDRFYRTVVSLQPIHRTFAQITTSFRSYSLGLEEYLRVINTPTPAPAVPNTPLLILPKPEPGQ